MSVHNSSWKWIEILLVSSVLPLITPTVSWAESQELATNNESTEPEESGRPLIFSFGLTSRSVFERIVLDDSQGSQSNYNLVWKPIGLTFGFHTYYRSGDNRETGGFRGSVELGVEMMLPQASLPLSVTHSTIYEFRVGPRVTLFTGLELGLFLNLGDLRHSHGHLGVPLGISVRRVEILYTPSFTFPLAVERLPAYSGEFRRAVGVHFQPLNLSIRVKFGRTVRRATRDDSAENISVQTPTR